MGGSPLFACTSASCHSVLHRSSLRLTSFKILWSVLQANFSNSEKSTAQLGLVPPQLLVKQHSPLPAIGVNK